MRSLVLVPLILSACFSYAKPVQVAASDPSSGQFPHELLDSALEGYVTPDGLIDYNGLRADQEGLNTYLGYVAAVSPATDPELFPTDDHALAYYLNGYNALAVRGVLDRPEMVSVDAEKVDYFYYTRYSLGGEKVSLYKLENSIIREQFADPRIHFYLNCQSASCPDFPQQAIQPESLDATLEAMTTAFMNNPRNVTVADDGVVEVSRIMDWYGEDFEAAGGVLSFVHRYNSSIPETGEVRFKEYDWTLIDLGSGAR